MNREELGYTKEEINRAGRVLRGEIIEGIDADKALNILDNWRAVHSYPMQVFYVRLRTVSKRLDGNSLTAERLKRASSIIAKLKRRYHGHEPSMTLYQMQDIAGCRTILSNVDQVRKLTEEEYLKKKGDLKHRLVGKKDYIATPKTDGYRGIHLIYSYVSDKENKKKYNGLLVEIQIRSKLQHVWATAVETVGFFTRQAIKSNEGTPEWAEFFRLVSAAFAKMEDSPIVPDTPVDEKELYTKIVEKEHELNVISKIRNWRIAMNYFDQELKKRNAKFFLLELDIKGERLLIQSYSKRAEQKAIQDYAAVERRYSGNKEYDVVLAGIDAAHDLEKAYPNYFVDTNEFLMQLNAIINKVEPKRQMPDK